MRTHRIMSFVGNGFDISVLLKFGKGVTTSYSCFYSFFMQKYPNKMNLLITQMEEAKKTGKENWSDFEAILYERMKNIDRDDIDKIDELNKDLLEIQQAFSHFLNGVVNNDIIDKVSTMVSPCKTNLVSYGHRSMSEFIGDLSEEQYKRFRFHNMVDNHDYVLYTFINFNYTALLDNYVYLDKEIFDPSPYSTSNNNFKLLTNPNGYKGHRGPKDPYCHLLSEVFHPHGYQDVPKSLLFGMEPDSEAFDNHDKRRKFVKSVWARSEELYGDYFENTKLFIIYGCSLGKSDNWWWRRIFARLVDSDCAELIIYNYGTNSEEEVIDRFFEGCCLRGENKKNIALARDNIYVINFGNSNSNNIKFLQV